MGRTEDWVGKIMVNGVSGRNGENVNLQAAAMTREALRRKMSTEDF